MNEDSESGAADQVKFVKILRSIMSRKDLTSSSKIVYSEILDRQGKNGESWPSVARLAEDCGMNRKTVLLAIALLETRGLVEVARSHRQTNRYKTLGPERGPNPVPKADLTRSQNGTNPVQEWDLAGPKMGLSRSQNGTPTRLKNQTKEPDQVKLPCSTTKRPVVKRAGFSDDDIGLIYKAYPRKIGRQKAIKAIEKALKLIGRRPEIPDASAWLLERVSAYASSAAGRAGRFTPYPATWFNRGSYDDDPVEWDDPKQPREALSEDIMPEVLEL